MNELPTPQYAIMMSLAISIAIVAIIRAIARRIDGGRNGSTQAKPERGHR